MQPKENKIKINHMLYYKNNLVEIHNNLLAKKLYEADTTDYDKLSQQILKKLESGELSKLILTTFGLSDSSTGENQSTNEKQSTAENSSSYEVIIANSDDNKTDATINAAKEVALATSNYNNK